MYGNAYSLPPNLLLLHCRHGKARDSLYTLHLKTYLVSFYLLFSIPYIIFALLFSLPPSRNRDPGSHSWLFSPPPHYGSCLAFLSRVHFDLSSLADSCQVVLTHARCSQQLILLLFLQINSKSRHGEVQTHGPKLFIVAFEGYH